MNTELITAVAIGIGLAASAGFRVFVPMLVAAIAAKTGVLPLNESFLWLSSWTAIAILGTATVVEILAYYIPVVDNLLDTISTPLAIGAGTLLLTSVLPIDSELHEVDHRRCRRRRQRRRGTEWQRPHQAHINQNDGRNRQPGGGNS